MCMYRSTDFRRPAVGYNISKANCRATLENIITYYVLKLWEKEEIYGHFQGLLRELRNEQVSKRVQLNLWAINILFGTCREYIFLRILQYLSVLCNYFMIVAINFLLKDLINS